RKTDKSDTSWIADLLGHGVFRHSLVPPTPIQELRDLTRTRKQMVRERSQHVLRVQKVLEDANVKLASVLTDIQGQSGRDILSGILAGIEDPNRLAEMAHPRVKASREKIAEALEGKVSDHHRFMLRLHLGQIDGLDRALGELESRIAAQLSPFREAVELLES